MTTIASGSTPEVPIDNPTPRVKKQIDEYVATDGAKPEFRGGTPLILLTVQGRKSGEWRRTCLIGLPHEGAQVIVASLGGAPDHPNWYLNLKHNPHVLVQVKDEVFWAVARDATPAEKPLLWEMAVASFPDYAGYQKKTEREIPVVLLEREHALG